jgi:hypothetical protein
VKASNPQAASQPSVFIISTFTDLFAEREAVAQAAERAGLRVIRAEEYVASTSSPLQMEARSIRSADLIVLIVAFRYGFVPRGSTKSVNETELEQAHKRRKAIFVYMLSEDAPWPVKEIATGKELARIEEFRRRLREQYVVRAFRNAEELQANAFLSFLSFLSRKGEDRPGLQGVDRGVEPELAFGPMLLEIRSQLSLLVQRLLTEPRAATNLPGPQIRPSEFLGRATATPDPDRVFVIMPYSMPWSEAVERVLREACQSVGAKFEIAKSREGRFIINDIWKAITGSFITIADLTGGNPNVAYEVGLADVLGRQVILISQESEVPVDFRGARLILYKNTIEGALALRETVTDRLRTLRSAQADKMQESAT